MGIAETHCRIWEIWNCRETHCDAVSECPSTTFDQRSVVSSFGLRNRRSGISTARLESADVTEFIEASSIGTEPSFVKNRINNPRMGPTGKFTGFTWNRGRYFFSADAPTSDLLDSFMAIFRY